MNPCHPHPPKWAHWLLKSLLKKEQRDWILGDFEELFQSVAKEHGITRAKLWYWAQVFKSIPSFVKKITYWSASMLKNYLRIAFRNLKRHKLYSFINISGLGIGLACCLLIFIYVKHELSYDRFHENSKRIYRAVVGEFQNGKWAYSVGTPEPLGAALEQELPEVEQSVRFFHPSWIEKWSVSHKNRSFYEEQVFFTDPSFFEVFSFPLIQGNSDSVLDEPHSIVISQKAAQKYFGSDNPIGKVLMIDHHIETQVTGVTEDVPPNSHFRFDFLVSFDAMPYQWILNNWRTQNCYTYLLLQREYSQTELEPKLSQFLKKHFGPMENVKFDFQPLTDIHLHSRDFRQDMASHIGDISSVYTFSAIAVFILIIACINFVNLTTARSINRAKEVGMRKVIGAQRMQLIRQFFGESVLFSLMALLLAVVLALSLIPNLNRLIGQNLSLSQYDALETGFVFLGIALLAGILSGIYPALYLSKFQPIKVIMENYGNGTKGAGFRKILVVAQFSISIVLIIGTLVISRQNRFCMNKKLGFDQEQVLVVPMWDSQAQKGFLAFKNTLLKNPEVMSVSGSSSIPGESVGSRGMKPEGNLWSPRDSIVVDEDFIPTFGIEVVQGRNFSTQFPTDREDAYILNQAAVQEFGWEEPIGKQLIWKGDKNKTGNVIGVVQDFHYESLHQKIEPLVLFMSSGAAAYTSVRIRTQNTQDTIASIKKTWNQFHPGHSFESFFMDSHFDRLYRSEIRMGKIFRYFTFLALFVSCLGLFGLTSFMVNQRTKEIGIRKVLGASGGNIVMLFSQEFMKWVLVANLLAWPIAYVMMNKWLQNFAYRVRISLWTFLVSAVIAVLIAFVTVSFQSLRAARTDPVESLRYE
ncbi:MAG: FtsX-like permease family protein [Candidatus Aminicenantes bacterium]|nr:FtsX-like permease family protein [Candidatus Aminicenantes bacterium]